MYATTLSSKYQISIPKHIRDELEIKAGQKFVFISKGNVLMLVPFMDIAELKGCMAGANPKNYRDYKDRI